MSTRTGPGAAGGGDVEGLGDHPRDLVGVGHEVVVLGDRHRDAADVGLLEGVGADGGRADLTGDGDDRHRVHVGVGERGDQVGRARARGRHADADLAGRGGVALGGVAGTLLVANEDVAHLDRVEQRVVGRQDRPARDAEDGVDLHRLEREHQALRTGHLDRRARPRLLRHLRGARGARGALGAGGARGARSHWGHRGRRPGLAHCCHRFLGLPLLAAVIRAQKNPPVPWRDDGGSASDLNSIRRAGKVRGLGPQVNSPPARMPCQPARRPVPRSGTVRSLTLFGVNPPVRGARRPRRSVSLTTAVVERPPCSSTGEPRMSTEATVVFVIVVGLRFLVPLFIPKWPLPAVLACLVLDGIDQSIFQRFGFDPPGYQNYDKAMDLFYLSIAFLASLQNWTRSSAVGISRFLFFYRMVGVMAFEITGNRTLLLIFPNTFEYFFIAYELVRLRWDPRRFSTRFWLVTAACIWICRQAAPGVLDPRRPARLHRHLAGRVVVRAPRHRRGPRGPGDPVVRRAPAPAADGLVVAPRGRPAARRDGHGRRSATRGPWPTSGCSRGRPSRRSCSSACSRRSTRASCPGSRCPTCGCSSASRSSSSPTPRSRSPPRSAPGRARGWPATSGRVCWSTSCWCWSPG